MALYILRILVLFFTFIPVLIKSEMFTAVVDLETLLYTEGELLKTLEKYIETEEQRLQKVKRLREEYKELYNTASQDVQTFLANPVNAFILVKRLTADWKAAEYLIQGSDGRALIENITHHRADVQFPDDEDLSGAAVALLRLQDTYKLDTSTLAKGQIQGTKPSPELTAGDCFELGRQSYNNQDHYHTILWMQEALERIDEEVNKTAEKSDILEFLAFSTYMQGNVIHALKLTNDLLQIAPHHSRAKGNKAYFEDAIKQSDQRKRGDDGEVPSETPSQKLHIEPSYVSRTDKDVYEQLCRGENMLAPHLARKLKCQYLTKQHPYLILHPVKEEELYLSPRIVLYHGILSDKEIDVIKSLAHPRLRRATVQNAKSGELEVASYRISKSSWLKNEDHPIVERLSQRIEDITGLTLSTAEELQVVNYGIGGHYEPHFDFARKEETNAFKSLGTGNRIATWLNYMSDVDAGGATVFPQLGISVWPRKGSAAFWYNLHKNGEGNILTRHAACPVLVGSKWVSNKWIHERGQEFRYRCDPDPDI